MMARSAISTVPKSAVRASRVAVVFGTRPEAIKMCPVALALRASAAFETLVCVTGQHREMLDQVCSAFDVSPDVDLRLMTRDQSLAELTSRALAALDDCFAEISPDLVLVQGDTTSAFCAALVAFYRRIPVAHVEAGLRTGNLLAPFPEEANRALIGRLAVRHFAPTESARANLLRESVPEDRIEITGNTVIDALQLTARRAAEQRPGVPGLDEALLAPDGGRLILVTGHRRESFGAGIEAICVAVRELAQRFPDVNIVYPLHPNPNVRLVAARLLRGPQNVHLLEPLEYLPFVRLMARATLLLTDSGGIQEEGPALHKPVLVMRDTTERPEAVEAGAARLVGTCARAIVDAVEELLTDAAAYARMARGANPYGDGTAARRIARSCEELLGARRGVEAAAQGRDVRSVATRRSRPTLHGGHFSSGNMADDHA